MQTDTYTDTDTDELQILDDTVEVRALFEKKAEGGNSAVAQGELQDKVRTTSAIPIHTQREPGRQIQLKNASIPLIRMPERSGRIGEYKPTQRDITLGVKWTLLSAETVRHDIEREIQEMQ
jgi:hypothetical protein